MITWYRPLMAFHVIAIISWMAGILYLYRLLIYASERRHEHEKIEELLQIMSRRLLKAITIPAMLASWVAGLGMTFILPILWQTPWFLLKFLCVLGLTISTLYAWHLVRLVQVRGTLPSGRQLRFQNEIPTLFMILIVCMVILKPAFTGG